jgi:hypothetical protein
MKSKNISDPKPVAFRNNPMGPIRAPHAFELEPVIAADIGLVDECLRLPASRKNGRSVAASGKKRDGRWLQWKSK